MPGVPAANVRPRVAFTRLHSQVPRSRHGLLVQSQASSFSPPTVADTKQKFIDRYDVPVSSMYSTVIQELLVQQHFMRHNTRYKYDEIFALGICSVFSQILDDLKKEDSDAIFKAYVGALDEDAEQYTKDSDRLTELAQQCSGPEDLKPDSSGNEVQKLLADVQERAAGGKFFYTRFFAIGLFRMLELTGARDPKALESLVSSLGLRQDLVNKDLMLYKSILSKMSAAKELMAEFLEREQRKQKERDEGKAAASSSSSGSSEGSSGAPSDNGSSTEPAQEGVQANASSNT